MCDSTLIVLEGPDLAGKSTLARQLVELYDGPATIVANGKPPSSVDLRAHYETQALEAASRCGLTVFDRLHVGELIYGPLYRGHARLTRVDCSAIDSVLDDLGAQKLHVDVSDEILAERFSARGDDLVRDLDTLLLIAREYRELFSLPAPSRWNRFQVGSSASALDLIR